MAVVQDRDRWIWPFELQEKIGEGGMGVVYRARYVVNNRQVAVKLIPSDVTDGTMLARFERELEILKSLRHPNIVRCFGGVCENRRRFYAMELVEGGTLETLLHERGRLPWEQVVEYGLQMCAALSCAHQHGVVHRDVKPGNFLIAANGRLKLSDFGLATVSATRKITMAGKTMGTYCYMAPEQIRGQAVTSRMDLYALGCVLFELAAGRPPFLGETAAEILQQHLKQAPPRVTQFAIDCPPTLEQIIAELLEKDAQRRPSDADEVARRLREVTPVVVIERPRPVGGGVSQQPTPTPPQPARQLTSSGSTAAVRSMPGWMTAAAVALLAVLLVWNVSLLQQRQHLRQAEALWLEAYAEGEPAVRVAAARALGEIGRGSPAAVAALIDGLLDEDEDRQVRYASATALGETGSAEGAIALTKARNRAEYHEVRTAADAALHKIGEARDGRTSWAVPLVLLIAALAAAGLMFARRAAAGQSALVRSRMAHPSEG